MDKPPRRVATVPGSGALASSTEIVSSDLVGSRHAGVVDSQATISEGHNVVLYVWYDNEFGYSCQVVRLAQQMAGIQFASFPA